MAGTRGAAPVGAPVVIAAALVTMGFGLCPSASAQKPETYRYNGSGYATFGIGSCQHGVGNVSFGGGAEGFVWRGLTVGGDMGYYRFVERGDRGFGIATVNVGYNFADRNRRGRWDGFLNAGIPGLGFGGGGATPAGALGGGVNYWVHPRVGIRTEVRVTGMMDEGLVMFRVGLSFR